MWLSPVVAAAQFIREKYWEYEYEEVVTPNMYNLDLWKTSGHADHYKVCTMNVLTLCYGPMRKVLIRHACASSRSDGIELRLLAKCVLLPV